MFAQPSGRIVVSDEPLWVHITIVLRSSDYVATIKKLEHKGMHYGEELARNLLAVSRNKLAVGADDWSTPEGISMKVGLKMLRALYENVREDLARPHEFAYERVGFLSAKLGNASSKEPFVLFTGFSPVPDDQYIEDHHSGARINSDAIREAMQRVLDTGEGLFHVHGHEHRGKPRFSFMDFEETPRIVSSLRVAAPKQAHGMILLSTDDCTAQVWLPMSTKQIIANRVSLVGYPLEFLDQDDHVER